MPYARDPLNAASFFLVFRFRRFVSTSSVFYSSPLILSGGWLVIEGRIMLNLVVALVAISLRAAAWFRGISHQLRFWCLGTTIMLCRTNVGEELK